VNSRRGVAVAAGVVLAALVFLSIRPPAPLPPLGPLLDPAAGAWSAARSAELPRQAKASVPGLTQPVDVRYDDHAVPHLFGASELDLTRALGYVVARDRLFQLELQARAGAGRLAGLVGAAALPVDREIRSLGLPDAARRRFAGLSVTDRRQLEAFSDGVNAWLSGLGRRDLPLEYHLLGTIPERWAPVNSLYLLGQMSFTLALSDLEELQAAARAAVGPAAADALYPINSPIQEPLQPNGQRAPRFDGITLPPPAGKGGPAGSGGIAAASPAGCRIARRSLAPELCLPPAEFDALGSNNWAVAPSRSANGHALLAGDQHLDLTLPAIWYEAHLVVPDSLDVYGVTIPGAAAIIIGFNRDVAWTFTNTEADVLDTYAEMVDDTLEPSRYRLDGAWRPLRTAVERYLGRRGQVLAVDTLRYTHRGPLRRVDGSGRWVSVRWTVLENGAELAAFSKAARATSGPAWLDSVAGYRAPAQNMLVADRAGTIAIRSTGRFPIRPAGRGDLVQPGDQSASDWSGDWSLADVPQAINPAQGYLASANQQPVDPRVDPHYLGANWYSPWRALRINQLLRRDSAVTPDAMRRYQTDPGSPAADILVPAFLAAARRFPAEDSVQRAATLLAAWDRRYTRENTRAVLYEAAVQQLQSLLWDELGKIPPPALAVTAALLRDSASVWWDDHRTDGVREDRDRLLTRALARGLSETIERHGEPDGGGWRWERVRHANIYHLLRIRSLSALGVPMQGGQSTLNPSSGRGGFGSSWRMVVELGPDVRAWGVYPGGQSGNPASSRYMDLLPRWRDGELDTLRLPRAPAELGPNQRSSLQLLPAAQAAP
jgi:penicillin amidase